MAIHLKVQVILFTEKEPRLFLALRYNDEKGGYWQPVTGSVEAGESLEEAALREAREETSIDLPAANLMPAGYTFDFHSFGKDRQETVFGLRVPSAAGAPPAVAISHEHREFRWCAFDEALALYRWDSNQEGLRRLAEKLNR